MPTASYSPKQQHPTLVDIDRELSRRSLVEFIRLGWHVVEPATPYIHGWHIDAIAEHLEAVSRGDIRNLVINMPPRHAKSLLVSVFWPVWEWTQHPERRWLYSSYAASLSIRDSLKCRRLIESPWFQERWGHVFQLTNDQNAKIRYDNDKTGYRIATSVGGAVTGEGGDRVVCLAADVSIATNHGDIPVGRIVNERLPVKVLGPSGTWQEIEAYERNPAKPIFEIETEDGSTIRCTEDHPLYVIGRGYVPAREVIYSTYGSIYLRRLRQSVRQAPGSCSTGEDGDVLLPGMFRRVRAGQEQSNVERRQGRTNLSGLQHGVSLEAIGSSSAEVLQPCVQNAVGATSTPETLPVMQYSVCAAIEFAEVLQQRMCKPVAPNGEPWRSKRSLQAWGLGHSVYAGVPKDITKDSPAARQQSMRGVSRDEATAGTSYRWIEDQPHTHESRDALCTVPPEVPHEDRDQFGLDEPVRIVAVRSLGAPDAVYNLRVAPDHAYYANGLLTHNCDDPHNVNDASSPLIRERTLEWWDQAMSTRLNDPKTGAKVIVMQRVHQDDLSGHVLKQGGYEHLKLPAEYEGTKTVTCIGWEDPRTEPGELLWPERFGEPELVALKRSMGAYAAAGQLQQRPAPLEGGLIKKAWWKFYRTLPALDGQIQSWDMAFKDTKASDFVAGQVWGHVGADRYLIDRFKKRVDFVESVRAVETMSDKHPLTRTKLVEDKANGPAVISTLRHKISGLIPVTPEGGKVARVNAVAPSIESGNVYLPHPDIAPWVGEFIEECAQFPNGAHDDEVDAMSQALLHLENRKGLMVSFI